MSKESHVQNSVPPTCWGNREKPWLIRKEIPPLYGVRVIDFSQAIAGPMAAQRLANLGADVIKIEPFGGDLARFLPPFYMGAGGMGIYFASANYNKRSIVIDPKKPEGQEIIHKLVGSADVLIINNPDAKSIKEQGLDEELLAKLNPNIIVAAISCYGHTGPDAGLKGFDLNMQAFGGTMFLTGSEKSDEPFRSPVPWIDVSTAKEATIAILAGLYRRNRLVQPIPKVLDISLLNSSSDSAFNVIGEATTLNRQINKEGHRYKNIHPYTTYPAKEGWITIAIGTNKIWKNFCLAINMPDLIDDPQFKTNDSRVSNRIQLDEILKPLFQIQTADQWENLLKSKDIPGTRVRTLNEFLETEQAQARQVVTALVEETGKPPIYVASDPLIMSGIPLSFPGYPPGIGEHTDRILYEIGYLPQEIVELRNLHVVD